MPALLVERYVDDLVLETAHGDLRVRLFEREPPDFDAIAPTLRSNGLITYEDEQGWGELDGDFLQYSTDDSAEFCLHL